MLRFFSDGDSPEEKKKLDDCSHLEVILPGKYLSKVNIIMLLLIIG